VISLTNNTHELLYIGGMLALIYRTIVKHDIPVLIPKQQKLEKLIQCKHMFRFQN